MIESRSQTGHRRKMTSAQFAAQSVSNLCAGAESEINRIVAHRGSALRRWPAKIAAGSGAPSSWNKNPTGSE